MPRTRVSTGSAMEKQAGYSRAIVAGDWCFVSGTTGYDYATMDMPGDVAGQARNAFATIEKTLNEAGFALADIVRVVYYVTDEKDSGVVMSIAGEFMGDIRPAATMVVAGLVKPEMKVEIEATALRAA
ncbi:MAG: RidA family protein [Pseudomonadota bacterium]